MLDFFLSLPKKFNPKKLINEHFKRGKDLQEKYQVKETTTELNLSFLREIIKELQDLRIDVAQRFREITEINQEIETKTILEFFQKSPEYLKPLITLAVHYQKDYQEGLPLFGKIITALIKGDYLQKRYNLNDKTTREQLSPLISGCSKKEQAEIIKNWRDYYPVFDIKTKEEVIKKGEILESPELRKELLQHLQEQIVSHKHFTPLIKYLSEIEEKARNTIIEILYSSLSPKEAKIDSKEFNQILKNFPKEKKAILFGISTLLKDLRNPEKSLIEISKTISKLEEKIDSNWPELRAVEAIGIDILSYLKGNLEEIKTEKPREIIPQKTICLTYFTDNPLTLLEIGKYPVPTCQNYESTGILNQKILGYIFDAHLKAHVIREIFTKEEVLKEELNDPETKIRLDEDKGKIKITLSSGKEIEGSISKPIARRIVLLGEKEKKPVLVLEPIYASATQNLDKQTLLEESLSKLRKNFPQLLTSEKSSGIDLPKSHNPAGYYRDR